jgi:hypothetical protein
VTGTVCDGHAIAARLEITDGQALPGILARTVRQPVSSVSSTARTSLRRMMREQN